MIKKITLNDLLDDYRLRMQMQPILDKINEIVVEVNKIIEGK